MTSPLNGNLSATQQLTTATYDQKGQPYPDQPQRDFIVHPTEQGAKESDFLLHD